MCGKQLAPVLNLGKTLAGVSIVTKQILYLLDIAEAHQTIHGFQPKVCWFLHLEIDEHELKQFQSYYK